MSDSTDVPCNDGCPCRHTTPCHERCTCVVSHSSRGCRRCCNYGSKEQQIAAAERLAKQDRELAVERAAIESTLAVVDEEMRSLRSAILYLAYALEHPGDPSCQDWRMHAAAANDWTVEELVERIQGGVATPRTPNLAAENYRLQLYERACQSMADQFVHPKTTAEQVARDLLKEAERT